MGNFAQNGLILGSSWLGPFSGQHTLVSAFGVGEGEASGPLCGFELRLKVGPQSQAVSGQFHKMAQ